MSEIDELENFFGLTNRPSHHDREIDAAADEMSKDEMFRATYHGPLSDTPERVVVGIVPANHLVSNTMTIPNTGVPVQMAWKNPFRTELLITKTGSGTLWIAETYDILLGGSGTQNPVGGIIIPTGTQWLRYTGDLWCAATGVVTAGVGEFIRQDQ